jgi:hypothetical protein
MSLTCRYRLQALERGASSFFVPSTHAGANWTTSALRVNTDSTANDQWMPAIAVRPDGNQLFIGWLDRRNDTNNSLIDVYGRWGTIATNGIVSFPASEFRITTQSFPPAFSGRDTNNIVEGHYDPVWAPGGVNLHCSYTNWWPEPDPDFPDQNLTFSLSVASTPLKPDTLPGEHTDSSDLVWTYSQGLLRGSGTPRAWRPRKGPGARTG